MRKEKTVELDDRAITVREIKTSDAINLFETKEGMQICIGLISGLPQDIKKVMMLSVDLTPEEFDELTEGINNFTILEQAVREVNADFFASLPQRMQTLTTSAQIIVKSFGASLSGLAGLSRKDT
jgi:cytoplasmic iron level regulating protein YaaA (DUF328/UPF0246 family)